MLRQVRKLGVLNLNFTGGEIFTRDDIFEIIEEARKLYCSTTILSNASLLNENMIRRLSTLYINNFSTTIFSMIGEVHDAVTGIEGSFRDSIKNILLLREYGVPVTIKTPILTINKDSYLTVRDFCKKERIMFTMSPTIFAKSNGDLAVHALRVNNEDLKRAVIESDKETSHYKAVRTFIHDYPEPCATVYTNLAINCKGDVTPCNSMYYILGNVLEDSIENIWNNSKELEFIRSIKKSDLECNSCYLEEYCERCPGIALLENNTFYGCCDSCRAEALFRYENERRI